MKFRKFRDLPRITKLAYGSGSSIMFGLLFGFVFFPVVFKHQLKKEMSLRNKTDMKEMWERIPFPLEFKVWAWNITNPVEVAKGSKPVLAEVGPYVYEKWIEKVNLIENKEEDSIEFNRKDTYYFKPELSGGLTGDEMVYSPHILIIATASVTAKEKPSFLKSIPKALNAIFKNPEHIFPLHRVKDVLFDGVLVDCNVTDFIPKAVCNVYKTTGALQVVEANFYKYSFFGTANGTDPRRYKVLRGIKNITDVGRVIEFDGKTSQDVWNGEHCNNFVGTDATIFRPMVTEKDQLWTFSPEICRSIGTTYKERSSYSGIKSLRFVADLGDIANEPENHCFCNAPGECPAKGMMEISKCVNVPFVVSLPHFHKVDPRVQSTVIGMSPDDNKHGIVIDFEPISGTPLYAKKRLQLNYRIEKIPQLELFAQITDSFMPVIWIEEGLALNKTFIKMLNHQLFYPLKAVKIIKWISILGGIVGSVYTFILYRKNKTNVSQPRATDPTAQPRNENSNEVEYDSRITPMDKSAPRGNRTLPGINDRF